MLSSRPSRQKLGTGTHKGVEQGSGAETRRYGTQI